MKLATMKDMKTEELIDITYKIDDVLHNHGYIVDHDILSHYIFKVIKESYPNDNIELEDSLNFRLILESLPDIV